MKVKIEPNGWAKLNARLEALIAADPKVGRQSDLFAQRLRARQQKAFAHIFQHPNSKAYRDYVLVPGETHDD